MRKCKLGDLFQIKQGFAFKSANYVDNSQYAIVTLANISESNNFQYNLANMRYYEGEFPDSVILKSGDLILPMTEQVEGLFGNSAFVPKENNVTFVLNQRVGLVKPFLDSDRFYIHYLLALDSVRQQLEYRATGTRQRNISPDGIYDVNVEIHEPKERERIGEFLYRLEQKVNNNNNIIQLLESKGKEFYDYWFVQFEFPDANGRPYKTSGGKMEWNETLSREIPAGWEVKKLSSLCELKNGINYDKSVKGDKLYRIVNVRNITATSLLVDEQDLDEIKLLSKQAEKYLVGDNDILIARSGNPGAVRLLTNNHNVIYCGFIICCQVLSEMLKLYLTFTLKKYEGTNLTKTGGSIMQNVSQDTLNSIDVIVPPQDIIQVYNEKVISMVEKIKILVEETNKLANLRDFLLPMLMNGQVTFRQ